MAEPLYPLLSLARLRMGVDGEGVTTLIAGQGCPLRCRWCINASLLREAPAESVTAAELMERVRLDDLYFRATGGGVTFGGGEALLHAAFIRRFREICPGEWKISAETSLAVPRENVEIAADAVDLFIVDCKDMDGDTYRRYTGADNAPMRGNLRFLLDRVGPERVLVRVPLIPGYNTPQDQRRSAAVLRGMGAAKLELFDYAIRE
jgi:pyruvate formate lyase activating enzyme